MNIVNFNDCVTSRDFEQFGMSKKCAIAPLFYGRDIDEEKLLDEIRSETVAPLVAGRIPFAQMRIWLDANASDRANGITHFRYFIEVDKFGLRSLCFLYGSVVKTGFFNSVTSEGVHNFGVYAKDHWVPSGVLKGQILSRCRNSAEACVDSAAIFIASVNSPANFVAAVRPSSQGKSVEWMTARTHYVVLHKTHPANSDAVRSGDAVKETDKYLKRCAHSRRAHFRVLRSSRFRDRAGERVWVKSSWVGPKEWKQAGSIYRLAEIGKEAK